MEREKMLRLLKKYQMPIYVIIILAYMLVIFARSTPSIMGPELMKDININATEFGLVGLAFFWVYSLANAPAGAIVDRYGSRQSLIINLALVAIGSFIFSYAQSLSMLVFGRMVIAFATAGLFIVGVKSVTVWFTTKQFPTYYSVWMAFGAVGGLLATAPLQMLMSAVGWRFSIIIIAICCIVVGILAILFMKSSPADVGLLTPDEITGDEAPKKETAADTPQLSFWEGTKQVIKMPVLWLVMFYMWGCNSGGQVLVSMWGGIYLSNAYAFDKATVSNILTICAVGMVVGCIMSGQINKALGPAKTMLSATIIYLLHWFYLTLNVYTISVLELQVIFFINGFVQMYAIVAAFTALRQQVSADKVGTAVGLSNTFAWTLGAGLCSQIWGIIINSISAGIEPYPIAAFQAAMWFQSVPLIISFISAILLAKRLNKTAKKAA